MTERIDDGRYGGPRMDKPTQPLCAGAVLRNCRWHEKDSADELTTGPCGAAFWTTDRTQPYCPEHRAAAKARTQARAAAKARKAAGR